MEKGSVMQFRNAQRNEHGTLDCELLHPVFGWVPFTVEKSSILEGSIMTHGEIAPYVPAVVIPVVPSSISKLQAKLAAGPAIVAQIDAFMNDPEAYWAMKTAWSDAVELHRHSQMVDELAWVLKWDAAQIDAFFTAAAKITV